MNKKILKIILIITASIVALAAAVLVFVKFTNKNDSKVILFEDFNEGIGDFTTDAYLNAPEYCSFDYVPDGGVSGSGCVRIENIVANDARFVKNVDFKKDVNYKFSADIKVETLEGEYPCVGMSVSSLYASGFEFIETPCDYQHVEIYFRPSYSSNEAFCLRIGYFSRDTLGTCYFDNVKIETVASVPKGVNVATLSKADQGNTETENAVYNENTYNDMRLVSIFTLLIFTVIFVIWALYVKKTENAEVFDHKLNLKFTLFGLLAAAFIFRIILALTYYQCDIDVNLFQYWGSVANNVGMSKVYSTIEATGGVIDYPPLYIYFLALFAKLSGGNVTAYRLLVKLVPMISDLFIAGFLTGLSLKKKLSEHMTVFIAALWIFNPVVILDSACWGQVDSFLTVFVIMSAYFLTDKKYLLAGLFTGLGIMLKPQMIIFLPVFGSKFLFDFVSDFKEKKSFGYLWKAALGGISGLFLPVIPYLGKGSWIFTLFGGTIDSYNFATVNNYNFWFLIGKNWVSDSEKLGVFSIYSWGMIAIVFTCLVCLFGFVYLFIKKKNTDSFVYGMGAMVYLMVSCFGPRMHERYFFPALALLLAAFIISGEITYIYNYSIISAFGFISVQEIMIGLLVGGSIRDAAGETANYADYYWPSLTKFRGIVAFFIVVATLFSLVNVVRLMLKKEKKQC